MSNAHRPTPWQIGFEGFNANGIFNAQGEAVAQVYELPMHTTVAEVETKALAHQRYALGLANARLIVTAVNTHADAMELARMVTAWDQDECDMDDDRSLDMLHEIVIATRSLLAKSEGRDA